MRDKELWDKIEAADLTGAKDLFWRPVVLFGFNVTRMQVQLGVALGLITIFCTVPVSINFILVLSVLPLEIGRLPNHVCDAIILETKRFLYLLAVSQEPLVPSGFVASTLSQLVELQGENFAAGFGVGRITLTQRQAELRLASVYAHTIALRDEEFGGANPENIWPNALAIKMQLIGWGALALGIATIVLSQFGVVSFMWSLPSLILGGFLYSTEGPWSLSLPFRRSFMARLKA